MQPALSFVPKYAVQQQVREMNIALHCISRLKSNSAAVLSSIQASRLNAKIKGFPYVIRNKSPAYINTDIVRGHSQSTRRGQTLMSSNNWMTGRLFLRCNHLGSCVILAYTPTKCCFFDKAAVTVEECADLADFSNSSSARYRLRTNTLNGRYTDARCTMKYRNI